MPTTTTTTTTTITPATTSTSTPAARSTTGPAAEPPKDGKPDIEDKHVKVIPEAAPPPVVVTAPESALTVWPPFTPAGALDGVAALTGLPADPDVTNRPVLAVKVDNFPRARPQWNLDEADVIVEENVEGVTRFIALFHSRVPADVGPVRSSRTSDLAVLAALNRPVLAWSGGNPGVTAEVRHAAASGVLVDLSAQRVNCYRRNPSRSAPHNLVLDTTCALAHGGGAPARSPWRFDEAWQPAPGLAFGPDSTFTVPMDGVVVGWDWDPATGRYLRTQGGQPHVAADGTRVTATNVVTLYVPHVPSRIDARSPEAVTVGSGPMVLHRDGVATTGTWSRAGVYDPFVFRAADGSEMAVRPGTTFVQLARG